MVSVTLWRDSHRTQLVDNVLLFTLAIVVLEFKLVDFRLLNCTTIANGVRVNVKWYVLLTCKASETWQTGELTYARNQLATYHFCVTWKLLAVVDQYGFYNDAGLIFAEEQS
jgi:hypothetical protein